MEISNTKQNVQQAQVRTETASSAGKALPQEGREMPSVAIKAAPAVPEFEPKDLDKAIADLQDYVDGLGRNLSFARDESIDRSVITVRDTQTNQVVRQIPSEEVVAISRQIRDEMAEMRAGLLMDKSV
jgi:flagellar protein FlaG